MVEICEGLYDYVFCVDGCFECGEVYFGDVYWFFGEIFEFVEVDFGVVGCVVLDDCYVVFGCCVYG